MDRHVRLIILGAGTAGLNAFKEACRTTDDVVLIDPGPLGTTCARVGCMPSKALIKFAADFKTARRISTQGLLDAPHMKANIKAIMNEVRALRDRFASGPTRSTEALGKRFINGEAHFMAPDTVEVAGEHIRADAIIVATGSRPFVPDDWRALGHRLLTSDDIFELEQLPERLAVIGPGPVGCELGQALAWLGSEVHLFGSNKRVAALNDPDINAHALQALSRDLQIHTCTYAQPRLENGRVVVEADDESVEVDAVLAAVGRHPNIEDLNLSALDLELDERGLPALDPQRLRAVDKPVYFCGDVNAITPLMHEAADEGRLAAHYALNPDARCLARRTPLAITFTEPQMAHVGPRFDQLPTHTLTGTSDFSKLGRAVIANGGHGLLHIYAEPDGRLLGGEMAVPGAEHLAHQLAWLVQQRVSVSEALMLPYYHPVLEEGLRSALQDLRGRLTEHGAGPDLPLCNRDDNPLPRL